MKKILFIFLIAITILALAGCVKEKQEGGRSPVLSAMTASVQASTVPDSGSRQAGIWVSGEGKATAVPDIALLSLGIEAQARSVGEAQSIVRQAMSLVRQSLAAQGIEDKDIKTTSYNIQPVYQWIQRENRQELIGYRVSDRISAKIRKIQDAGKTIDAATEAGGNNIRIDGISLSVEDPVPFRNEAREKAIRDAMAKARQMAELAGVKLGKAIYITETGRITPPPRPISAPLMAKEAAAPPTEISPGEAEIQVQVQMAFAIE